MKVVDMRASLWTVVEDVEVKNDFLEIETINDIGPSCALHATKKAIDMQTVHTRIEPI